MLEVYERLGKGGEISADEIITLNHDQRTKGRLRATSESGVEVRIFIARGKPLLVGENLKTLCGKIVRVEGALENIAHASSEDWLVFSRACYHLGNRHVKLQVGERWMRFTLDHVLEEMVHNLGLLVTHENAVFEPESGAYDKGTHAGHSHD